MTDAETPPTRPSPASSAPTPPGFTAPTDAIPEGTTPPMPPTPPAASSAKSWLIAGGAAIVAAAIAIAVMSLVGHSKSTDSTSPGGAQATSAAATTGGRSGAMGTVTSVSGSSFMLKTQASPFDRNGSGSNHADRESYKVTTTGSTRITESVTGKASDLAKGDNIVIIGAPSDTGTTNGTITASRIMQMPSGALQSRRRANAPGGSGQSPPTNGQGGGFPGGRRGNGPGGSGGFMGNGRGGFAAGTITAITDTSVTVKSASGDLVTATIDADTTVQITKTIPFSAIKAGDTVRVVGKITGARIVATSISVGDNGFGFGPGRYRGGSGGGSNGNAPGQAGPGTAPGDMVSPTTGGTTS